MLLCDNHFLCARISRKVEIYRECVSHLIMTDVWPYTHTSLLMLMHAPLSLGVYSNVEMVPLVIGLRHILSSCFHHALSHFFYTSLHVLAISYGIMLQIKLRVILKLI